MTIKTTLKNYSISLEDVAKFQKDFGENPTNRVAMNAITNGEVLKVALNRESYANLPMSFSTEIESGEITAQKMSGRCWMFAALNALRLKGMKNMNLENFELSQSYIMFFDKLERSNYFLEAVLETIDEPIDSRVFMFLCRNPMEDGGQWDMFINLVNKYGVIPKEFYPESKSSSETRYMNEHLSEKLREFAMQLREAYSKSQTMEQLRALKEGMLNTIYRMLSIHNGVPPTSFYWSYKDKDKEFHQHDGKITPQDFFKQYIDVNFNDYISLINCPTESKPFGKHYTVALLGNVVEGQKVTYLNVEKEVMKKAALETLKSGEPVWFGCDVGKHLASEEGLLDTEAFQFDLFYNTEFKMDKAARVDFGHSLMTHAMLFTGVHEEEGKIVRWKVENSWGKERGRKGFLIMSDSWFDEYNFQVVVPKNKVSKELLRELDKDPIVLDPWDPMGSLA